MDAAFGIKGLPGGKSMDLPSGILPEDRGLVGNNHRPLAPKLRKPYTITKQREKWTEEEHKKFLEALQLHGRAWRRIEENIGTKTSVQIRSHAQKFFSKVTREDNNNVEIPPPRPKRKPDHPYPRKQIHPCRTEIRVPEQLKDLPSFSVSSVSEEENSGSPTSVLSLLKSKNIGVFFTKTPSNCTSLAAPATGSNEQENRMRSPAVSDDKDDKQIPSSDRKCRSAMGPKSDLSFEDSKKPVSSLKLFGRTVLLTDTSKCTPDFTPDTNGRRCESLLNMDARKSSRDVRNDELFPIFCCFPSYKDAANSVAEPGIAPRWDFIRNLPFPVDNLQKHFGFSENLAQFNVQNECSGTGSNTATERNVCDSQYEDQCRKKEAKTVEKEHSVFRNQKEVNENKSVRGFLPYRKVGEQKVERPTNVLKLSLGQSKGGEIIFCKRNLS